MERTLLSSEQAYKNMEAVAQMLQAFSKNGAQYILKDVYLDFGQRWMWTTIVRRGYRECQILCPRDWQAIERATSPQELAEVVEVIRNDKYFGD